MEIPGDIRTITETCLLKSNEDETTHRIMNAPLNTVATPTIPSAQNDDNDDSKPDD